MRRRSFLATVGTMAAAQWSPPPMLGQSSKRSELSLLLESIENTPVLDSTGLDVPVEVDSIELLQSGNEFLVRIRSRDGLESVTAPNSSRMALAHPVFLRQVAPFFIGKDARDLENLLWEVYRFGSNYKLQGLLFWICVTALEQGLLDLLGKSSDRSLSRLFGGPVRDKIAVYRASGNRGNTPKEEVDYLKHLIAETGAKAVKFRLGGRMSRNADSLPGRSEALIPLAREALGDEITLYADSNSSYDVANAVRIGRLMEDYRYAFFEEPCPFDHLWETGEVTATLDIPIAGGEQEFSMRRFRWIIENRIFDIVQPDLHYFGGFIRSTKVARMAHAAGMDCTVHMSGSGLGYVNVLHFAATIPNAGAHQEFKGHSNIPFECPTSSLKCVEGSIAAPTGPGLGVVIDPDYIARARLIGKTAA